MTSNRIAYESEYYDDVEMAALLGISIGRLRNSGGRVTDDVEQGMALLSGMTRPVAGDHAPRLSLAIVHDTDYGLSGISSPKMSPERSLFSCRQKRSTQHLR